VLRLWVVAPLLNLPPTEPTLPTPSDGESEVVHRTKELPTPKCLLSKVRRSDEVEHVLTRALGYDSGYAHRWKIFVAVSRAVFPLIICFGAERCLSRAS